MIAKFQTQSIRKCYPIQILSTCFALQKNILIKIIKSNGLRMFCEIPNLVVASFSTKWNDNVPIGNIEQLHSLVKCR